MAFVNLPPNLQDMFNALSDRISKLETGPNQAMYTAVDAESSAASAQSVATQAQIQAINAEIEANNAAAQATLASTQATAAQISANGKNTVTYSASTPSGSGTTTGDIWFQYSASASYNIIGQWVWNGSSWQVSPIANTVIANLDAGKITTGTITSIEYNNGSGTFRVTPAGALTASSATISGTVNATGGYFGSTVTGNYWGINSSGITGVGSATISAGAISGSSITTNSGTIAGWVLSASSGGYLANSGANTFLYSNPGTDGTAISTIGNGIFRRMQLNGSSGTTLGTNTLAVGGTMSVDSDATIAGNIRSVGTTNTTTGAAANMYINPTSGLMARSTASSRRYKHDIVNLTDVPELDPTVLYDLPVRAFRFNEGYLPATDERADTLVPGFIAEEVDAVYPAAADYENGQVETWNDRTLIPGLLALIQDLNARVKTLEGGV